MSEWLVFFIPLGALCFGLMMFKARAEMNKLNHKYAEMTDQVYLEGLGVFVPKRWYADED